MDFGADFTLAVLSLMLTCFSGLTVYLLKSRCTRIQCCCISCEREPIPLNIEDVSVPLPPIANHQP